jgi:Zn-dependent membrane protease YugP
MPRLISLPVLMVMLLGVASCASRHEQGVKSHYRSQWTNVAADTQAATEAARAVLEQRGLKQVTARSTGVDGVASAKMADDTNVTVDIKRVSDTSSQVSVTVGRLGDPKLGAELARQIQMRAEGR